MKNHNVKFTWLNKEFWTWKRSFTYQHTKNSRIKLIRIFWFMFTIKRINT